ncbi:hypothetical protein [Paenarthrobacter nicotinovorans]|uniref:hypothetical protein n=1 Tax=Paenarthrobacter nicotinovorans TaxID=29320 RepID=UPI0037484098
MDNVHTSRPGSAPSAAGVARILPVSATFLAPHSVVSQVKVSLFGINAPVGIAGSFFGITLGWIKGLGAKGVVGLTPQFLAVALNVAYFHSRTDRADNGDSVFGLAGRA